MEREPRKRSLSGVEHIRPNHDFARTVIIMGAGSLLTLLALGFAGVFSNDEPKPEIEVAALKMQAAAPPVTEAAKTPEPEPPPPPVVPTTGVLIVSSSPAVDVFNGDDRIGRTPVRLDMQPGTHTLRFVDRRRLIDTKRTFEVVAGERVTKRLGFAMARLKVQAPNGAKLSIDGRAFGKTPMSPIEVQAGKHTLVVRYKGEKIRQRIDMPKDRTYEYKVDYKAGGPIDD